jgi:hypothetical protein
MHKNIKHHLSLIKCMAFLLVNLYLAINEFTLLIDIALMVSAIVAVAYLVAVKNIHKEYISKISSIIDVQAQYHKPEGYSRKNIMLQFLILISVSAAICYFTKINFDIHAYNFIMIQAICGLFIFFLMLDYSVFKSKMENVNYWLHVHAAHQGTP